METYLAVIEKLVNNSIVYNAWYENNQPPMVGYPVIPTYYKPNHASCYLGRNLRSFGKTHLPWYYYSRFI